MAKCTRHKSKSSANAKVTALIRKKLGQRIRALRKSKGWSQEEFADICGTDRSFMGNIERGESNLTLSTMDAITRSLGGTISALFKGIA